MRKEPMAPRAFCTIEEKSLRITTTTTATSKIREKKILFVK